MTRGEGASHEIRQVCVCVCIYKQRDREDIHDMALKMIRTAFLRGRRESRSLERKKKDGEI